MHATLSQHRAASQRIVEKASPDAWCTAGSQVSELMTVSGWRVRVRVEFAHGPTWRSRPTSITAWVCTRVNGTAALPLNIRHTSASVTREAAAAAPYRKSWSCNAFPGASTDPACRPHRLQ